MRLYLTSYRVPVAEELVKLLPSDADKARVAFIANAKDFYIERARKVKTNATEEYLKSLGFKNVTEIDLRQHRDSTGLKEVLSGIDLLWVGGGNTFNLMEQVVNSGLDTVVKGLVEKELIYVGESAGAVIAGKSLRGIEPDDEPEFAEKIHYEGLGLVNKFILPHADNKFFASSSELSRQIYSPDDRIEINDNQAFVMNGNEQKIVTGSA